MQKVLVFGAGKSATVLIDYLLTSAEKEHWNIVVVDADLALAKSKIASRPNGEAVSFDIANIEERAKYVSQADIVISLLPPHLHILVANECLALNKNLLTASYMDAEIKKLEEKITEKGLLFLYEMGLDPGIDHMSAMQMIDDIKEKGGTITSFKSHCGGLVAPECDDNPWHYKISWNPRNIVLAGKAGAHYKENGKDVQLNYENLFDPERLVQIPELGIFGWYPNRDSLSYTHTYNLTNTKTFIRTTLRHMDFIYGWNNIIELGLTDETPQYDSDGKTLKALFKEHMDKNNFGEWLTNKVKQKHDEAEQMMQNLQKLIEAQEQEKELGEELPSSFLAADEKGNIDEVDIERLKIKGAGYMAYKIQQANLTIKQLFFLGLDDENTLVNKGICSPADLLQLALEKKLPLKEDDKDMIVILHEIE
jgi:saccharopine dehydrogenase-like NADP-dependent oxidoreductase